MTGDDGGMHLPPRLLGVGALVMLFTTLIPEAGAPQYHSLCLSVVHSINFQIGFLLSAALLVLITCSAMKQSDLHTQEPPGPVISEQEEGIIDEESQGLSVPDWVGISFDASFRWEVLDVVGDHTSGQISLADIEKQYYTRLVIQWYQQRSKAEAASHRQLDQLKSEIDFQVTETGEIDIMGHRAEFVGGSHAYSANDIGFTVLNRMLLLDCEKSGRFYYIFVAAAAYAKEVAENLMKKAMVSFSCHPDAV